MKRQDINLTESAMGVLRAVANKPGLTAFEVPTNRRGILRTLESFDLIVYSSHDTGWRLTASGREWITKYVGT